MKYFNLAILLIFLSNHALAVGPRNICADDDRVSEFKRIHRFYLTEPSSVLQRWNIELPDQFVLGYSLRSVSLVLSKTELLEWKGRSRERAVTVMNVPIQTHDVNGSHIGYFYMHSDTVEKIEVVALYKNDPAGVVSIDGDICELKLVPNV